MTRDIVDKPSRLPSDIIGEDAAMRLGFEGYDVVPAVQIDRLTARCKALEEALEPFARHINEMKFNLDNKGNELPDDQPVGWVYVTIGDFRRARRTLKAEKTDG